MHLRLTDTKCFVGWNKLAPAGLDLPELPSAVWVRGLGERLLTGANGVWRERQSPWFRRRLPNEAATAQKGSEPAPDEAQPYRGLEDRWREENRLSAIATIAGCEAAWRWLVEQVEAGYDDTIYDWQNDLDSRTIIQRAIDALPEDLAQRLADRVRPWDERFRTATRPAKQPYWSGGWWAEQVPAKLGPILRADLAPYL